MDFAIGKEIQRFGSDRKAKLYVRPEHTLISATAAPENAIPVTVGDVSFEGNFIAVQSVSDTGMHFTSELRNDGSVPIPEVGEKRHVSFDAGKAAILPDSMTAGA